MTGEETWPKLMTVSAPLENATEGRKDTLSWFGAIATNAGPEAIADLRSRNPNQRIYLRWMPQNVPSWPEGHTYWLPDTASSVMLLSFYYVIQNDWYLYDIYGERIEEWGGYAANWTRYCPKGTYGTSVGMTYAEWLIEVAIPQMAYNTLQRPDHPWERWGWDTHGTAYNALDWEILFDCPHCCVVDQWLYADPDRDGEAEGIETWCWEDGWQDSLSILMREVNEDFFPRIRANLAPDLVIRMNRAGYKMNPSWTYEMNGLKLEEWEPYRDHEPQSWWGWMYGRMAGGESIGDGYLFAEQHMHPFGVDEREGWDVTYIEVFNRNQEWDEDFRQQMLRWGLGTSMLGDGWFCMKWSETYPYWFDEYEWDFGAAVEDFQKEVWGLDTLYVRRFLRGAVEVNPYEHAVGGVAPQNSRFAFWLTQDDLKVGQIDTTSVALEWLMPEGEINDIEACLVRYATFPITPENWEDASAYGNGRVEGSPGEVVSYTVKQLEPSTTYYFALKHVVYGREEPGISNVVSATTEASTPPNDTTPPAAVADLAAPIIQANEITVTWTATGDDGDQGTADHCRLRYRVGGAIGSEADWNGATPVTSGLPVPGPPGTAETFDLSDLLPETTYGISVRVVDEADNLSGLSNPLEVTTLEEEPPPPEDATPPAAIEDLEASGIFADGCYLEWTAPGDDGMQGTAAGYVLGVLPGSAIEGEEDWEEASRITAGLPVPEPAGTGQAYSLQDLEPETTYGLALRAYDEADNLAPLGTSPLITTLAEETPAEPDTSPPAAIDDLSVSEAYTDGFLLQWTTPGDDGSEGTANFYVLAHLLGRAIESTDDWDEASLVVAGLPAPTPAGNGQWFRLPGLSAGATYGLSLRAYDEAGNLSPIGPALLAATLDQEPGPGNDTIPPAVVTDLLSVQDYPDGFVLGWTAPGDDGEDGTAAFYELAYREGAGIESEEDWDAAQLVADPPAPAPGGFGQTYRLRALDPETLYGLSIRATDEAGNRAAASWPPLLAITLPEEGEPGSETDTIPPATITDLTVTDLGESWADLTWSCPGDDGLDGVAEGFVLGWVVGEELSTEDAWLAANLVSEGLPDPGLAGTAVSFRLSGLLAHSTYTVVVRAFDDADALSLLGPAVTFTTSPSGDTTPPGAVTDLAASWAAGQQVELRWTAAGDDGFEGVAATLWVARRGEAGIDGEDDWASADVDSLVNQTNGGEADTLFLSGLDPSGRWGFALRYGDENGHRGEISNSPILDPLPDTIPPAPVGDLSVTAVGTGSVDLAWTATGDDSAHGQASAYRIGVAAGVEILPETWDEALTAFGALETDEPPAPQSAGSSETYTLSDLDTGGWYGIALDVQDEAGNLSGLSNRLWVEVAEAHVPLPPETVRDLSASAIGSGWVDLAWTAPAALEPEGRVTEYEIGFARVPITEVNWPELLKASSPPSPGDPGEEQSHRLGPVQAGATYWIALRSRDALGTWSAISNVIVATIATEDLTPPAAPPAPAVTLSESGTLAQVTWLASLDIDLHGYHVYGRAESEDIPERMNSAVITATDYEFDPPLLDENFYVSVSAVDYAGNESARSPESGIYSRTFELRGPFPHPIRDEARFELTIPPHSSGSLTVSIRIYSVTGTLVRRWIEEEFAPGQEVSRTWDLRNDRGSPVATGLYFLRIEAQGQTEIRRIYVRRD